MQKTRRILVAAVVMAASILRSASAADFNVSVSSSFMYVINGADNPTLSLQRGNSYTFAVNVLGESFYIAVAKVAGMGFNDAYTNGITGQPATVGTVTFCVPLGAPDTLYYSGFFHHTASGVINIVNPPPPLSVDNAVIFGNSNFVFTVNTLANTTNVIQASTNLTDWDSIGTNVPVGGSFTFTDFTTIQFSNRFYRVMR